MMLRADRVRLRTLEFDELDEIVVHHHDRGRATARQTFNELDRELAVRGGLTRMDAKLLLAVLEDALGAAQRARQRAADPQLVLTDRLLVEERVERNNALHVGRR